MAAVTIDCALLSRQIAAMVGSSSSSSSSSRPDHLVGLASQPNMSLARMARVGAGWASGREQKQIPQFGVALHLPQSRSLDTDNDKPQITRSLQVWLC